MWARKITRTNLHLLERKDERSKFQLPKYKTISLQLLSCGNEDEKMNLTVV